MKFNFSIRKKPAATNYGGAKSFVMTPQLELYSAIATTMLSDAFYEKADERLDRIVKLVGTVDPQFVARLAIYARQQMYLRTAPVVLATELARQHTGDSLVSRTVNAIVQRPDEIMEVLAYYQLANKRTGVKKLNKVSKQLQKGLAASFNKFDGYQFAKYNRDTEIKLRDALFLVHPKAKDEAQQELFNKIARQELATPYTWEAELSALGQQDFENGQAKAAALTAKWEELIASRRMGYMATLRNLRNILEAGVSPAHIRQVCAYLTDAKAVHGAKQLPFRFLAAYRELKPVQSGYTGYVMNALEQAIKLSVDNLQGFGLDTRVVIACDVSGSMQKAVSPKSKVMLYDIGLLLGMLLRYRCSNVVAGMFGNTWKQVMLPLGDVLQNVDAFYKREGEVGYATNGYLVIKDLVRRRYVADKVMLFTDMQLWDSGTGNRSAEDTLAYQWAAYKQVAPAARLYLFDLAGYGNTPVRMEGNDVLLIAGWSDKVFDMMKAIEEGESAVKAIEAIVL